MLKSFRTLDSRRAHHEQVQITTTDDSQHDEEKNYGDDHPTDKLHILNRNMTQTRTT